MEEDAIASLTHLNVVPDLLKTDQTVHKKVLVLNMTTANAAKQAAAYETALQYVKVSPPNTLCPIGALFSDWVVIGRKQHVDGN